MRDNYIQTAQTACTYYLNSTSSTGTSTTAVSIPSNIIILTSATFPAISSTPTSLINPVITFTNIASCSSYEVTPTYRTGLNPVTFGYSVYSYVSIGDLFCVKSGSSTLSVEIDKDSSETKDISWLSYNITTNKIEGTCRTPGSTYNLIIRAKPNLYLIDYQFTLKINFCTDAFCELCSNSITCDQCKSGYNLERNNTVCIVNVGVVTADTAGAISCYITFFVGILVALVFSCCASKISTQNIYSIFEYYHLLLSLYLLHIDFPDVVNNFIHNFKIFNFNFSEIYNRIGVNDSIKIVYAGSSQQNSKLSNLGFIYSSTILNFSILEVAVILVCFSHIFLYIISISAELNKDVEAHFKRIQSDKQYKPNFAMKLLVKIWRFFNRGFYISTFLEIFLFLTICCFSELAYFSNESLLSWLSLIGAILILILEIAVVTYCFYTIIKSSKPEDFNGPNESLFKCLKHWNSSARKYQIVFILRRTVIAFAAVFIHSRYLQFALYSVANFLHFGYILFVLPFERIIDNMIYLIADFSICAIGLVYSLFISNGDSTNYTQKDMSTYGEIICWIILCTNSIICVLLFISFALGLFYQIDVTIKKCRNKPAKKLNKPSRRQELESASHIEIEFKENKDLVVEPLSDLQNESDFNKNIRNASNMRSPISGGEILNPTGTIPRSFVFEESKLTQRYRKFEELHDK